MSSFIGKSFSYLQLNTHSPLLPNYFFPLQVPSNSLTSSTKVCSLRPPTAYKQKSAENLSATADTESIMLDSNAVNIFLKIFHRALPGVDILGLRVATHTLLLDWP